MGPLPCMEPLCYNGIGLMFIINKLKYIKNIKIKYAIKKEETHFEGVKNLSIDETDTRSPECKRKESRKRLYVAQESKVGK